MPDVALNAAHLVDSPDALPTGYTPLRRLHRGRDADVYEVWSDERACLCVAKCLRSDRQHEPRPRRRLLREGRLLRHLAHLHLARAYEVFVDPPTVILEVLTGRTLERRLEDEGRLPIDEVTAIGVQLCSVLEYLHRQALLHLDVKPSNIVCERGLIKLLDLSIARRPGRIHAGTGTRPYLAPEQASGGIVSPATDVWGVGMVLVEALTGMRPPNRGAGDRLVLRVGEQPWDVGRVRRCLPPQLLDLIQAVLAPVAGDRPSLYELRTRLGGGAIRPPEAIR
jgi:eukaryotic-like serine/threonine-protein kinase